MSIVQQCGNERRVRSSYNGYMYACTNDLTSIELQVDHLYWTIVAE